MADDDLWNAFVEGVDLVFSSWTALQLAIDNAWGGSQSQTKAENMKEDIIYWFSLCKSEPDIWGLRDQLFAAMLEDFNTEIEDGSLDEVAQSLITLYHQCKKGNLTLLEQFRSKVASLPKNTSVRANPEENEESDDDSMEEDEIEVPSSKPCHKAEMDDEGFTTVSRRRR